MTVKINLDYVVNPHIWNAYFESHTKFKHSGGNSFWDEYYTEHHVRLDGGNLVFDSEADYLMFLLRWL